MELRMTPEGLLRILDKYRPTDENVDVLLQKLHIERLNEIELDYLVISISPYQLTQSRLELFNTMSRLINGRK